MTKDVTLMGLLVDTEHYQNIASCYRIYWATSIKVSHNVVLQDLTQHCSIKGSFNVGIFRKLLTPIFALAVRTAPFKGLVMENSTVETETSAEMHRLRLSAENRKSGWKTVFGLLVAPIAMTLAWRFSHDAAFVRTLGTWIFSISSILFVLSLGIFTSYKNRLSHLSQKYSTHVLGVLGPVNQVYETRYEFNRFTKLDFLVYKKAYLSGMTAMIALFILLSYAFTHYIFNQIVWR